VNVMVIICVFILTAVQNDKDIDLNLTYIKSYPLDAKEIVLRPVHWKSSEWINAAVILGITGGLYINDGRIQGWVQKNRNDISDRASEYATLFGEKKIVAPSLFLYWFFGKFSHNKKAKYTALIGMESFILSGIFTNIIKYSVHRSRPYTGDPPNGWDEPSFSLSDDYLSFPSGHSTTAFAVAAVFASQYKDRFLPILYYSIAALTAVSRINNNEHWASDVFFGSVIGYCTAKVVLHAHPAKREHKFSLTPFIHKNSIGIMALWKLI